MLLPQGWWHNRYSGLHSASTYKYTLPSVTRCTISQSLRDAVDMCDAVWLVFGGRSQSYCEPWDHVPEFKTRSQILIVSFLSTYTQHFLLSVSPCGFSACFSPSTLHSSSSPVTQPDGSDSGVLPPSPSSPLPTFLSSSLSSPFSSPSLSSSLPICLVDISVSSVYYHIRKR